MHLQVLPIQVKNSVLICEEFRLNLVLLLQSHTNTSMKSGPGRMRNSLHRFLRGIQFPREKFIDRTKQPLSLSESAILSTGTQMEISIDPEHKTSQGSQVGHLTGPLWSDTSFTILVRAVALTGMSCCGQ